ncbi:MAG: hypothetical protein SGBAC_003175 [Bacillariaceae sp.]
MGNNNRNTTNATQSNRLVRTGLFHGLEMLATASDFVLKRKRNRVIGARPFKRLRRSKRKRKVHFNRKVQVTIVEHHSDYSDDERKAAFRSKDEIFAHAKRSKVEWMFEGMDWRNAPEEADYLNDIRNRIRYHPCWTIPRKPYHSGEMLYGKGKKRASYSPRLLQHMLEHGTSAFGHEE